MSQSDNNARDSQTGTLSLMDILERTGRLSLEQLERARTMEVETGQSLGVVVTRLGFLSERALSELYEETLGTKIVSAKEYPSQSLLQGQISSKFLRRVHALPIKLNADEMTVAMVNPLDRATINALAFATGLTILPRPAPLGEIEAALGALYPEDVTVEKKESFSTNTDKNDLVRLKDSASDAPVIRFVDRIIAEAVAARASDVHLESTRVGLRVRFRVDGVLHDREPPPTSWRSAVISRVKIMAGLNIAEHRLPQDGRIRLAVRGLEIDLRVATTPTTYGESLTLRILDRDQVALNFVELGFDERTLSLYLKALDKPTGMILVTGPTGSGKTTTLYASLQHLNSPDLKILSIEDPVEYLLEGVNQVQVKPSIGLTFAAALRSFLRLDPDILLVGEIRDLETAEIAIQAALTGHRVLSTLHTNDAATGITRLLDMGVAEYLVSSTVTAIVAQRLVRTLCARCKKEIEAPQEIIKQFSLDQLTGKSTIPLWQACGCHECNNTGYRGRSVIFELLPITDALRALILRRSEVNEIIAVAKKEGLRTMLDHGIAKALLGQTSIDEVIRVIGGN